MNLLTRLNKLSAPLALVTLTAFASSALRPSQAWAQSARTVPELEATVSESPPVATAAQDPAVLQSTAPEAESATAVPAPATAPSSTDENSDDPPGELTTDAPVAPEATSNAATAATAVATPRALPTGADKSGVTNKTISVPKGGGTVEGMGESFSAQLSTGIATFSVPFLLPAARGGAQPSLGLSYSSGGGLGVAGMGWEVGTPFIARQTDKGLPKYDDRATVVNGQPTASVWHAEQDRFVFNGGQELVPICVVGTAPGYACAGALADEEMPRWSAGWQYFRPRVEGSFLRFFWAPDHGTWRVQDKSGLSMELGVPLNGSNDMNAVEGDPDVPNTPGVLPKIYRWHLVREYDSHGNVNLPTGNPTPVNFVLYRYTQNGGKAYLTDIIDTTPASSPLSTNPNLAQYAHRTQLRYETRTDPTHSYRSGWRIEQNWRLKGVDITSKTFAEQLANPRRLVRRYFLKYDASRHVSLLESVRMEGRCTNIEGHAPYEAPDGTITGATDCPGPPAMKFSYSQVTPFKGNGQPGTIPLPGYEGFDERVHTLANSPKHSLDEDLTELLDINSDALPDIVVTAPGLFGKCNQVDTHGVFFNGVAGALGFTSAEKLSVLGVLNANSNDIKLSNRNVAPLDLDGDAIIDLLHQPQGQQRLAVYTPRKTAACWSGRTRERYCQ